MIISYGKAYIHLVKVTPMVRWDCLGSSPSSATQCTATGRRSLPGVNTRSDSYSSRYCKIKISE